MSRTEEYNGDANITMDDIWDDTAASIDGFWTGFLTLDAVDKRLKRETPPRSLLDYNHFSSDIAAMMKEEITKVRFHGVSGTTDMLCGKCGKSPY